MKLLLINYEFPPLGGGAGNATQNIAKELALLGHKVTVLTTWFHSLPGEEKIDGYRVVRVRSLRQRLDRSNPIEMLDFVRHARSAGKEICRAERQDFVLSFFSIPSGFIARYLKKKFGVPYAVSLRGGDVPGFLPGAFKFWHFVTAPLTKLIWKDANAIIANSEGLQDLALRTARPIGKDVFMIPNGVDHEIFKPSLDNKPSAKTRILFVGRLTGQKGVTYIVDAMNEILKKRSDLKERFFCDIVGDGPFKASLEEKVNNFNLSDAIVFHGWVPREKLPSFYQHADMFILPSSDEGMANVVLEAMASGLPIITTFVSGSEELVVTGENGMLVKDRTNLVPAMLDFLDNREKWRSMGRASFERSKKFDWAVIAGKYADLIR